MSDIRKVVSIGLRFVRCDVCGIDSEEGHEYSKDAYIAAGNRHWEFQDFPRRDLCPKCAKAEEAQRRCAQDGSE